MHAGSTLERALVAGDVAILSALFLTCMAIWGVVSGNFWSIPAAFVFGLATVALGFGRTPGRPAPFAFGMATLLIVVLGALYCVLAWPVFTAAAKMVVPSFLAILILYTLASLLQITGGKDHPVFQIALDLGAHWDASARVKNGILRILLQPFWSPPFVTLLYLLTASTMVRIPELTPVLSDVAEAVAVYAVSALMGGLSARALRPVADDPEDARWMILILRPFDVDRRRIGFKCRGIIERNLFPLRGHSSVGGVLTLLRHCRAELQSISDPSDEDSGGIAGGRFALSEQWQSDANAMAENAQGIILFSGASAGTAWEVRQAATAWQKTTLLIRNESGRDANRVFAASAKQFGYEFSPDERRKFGGVLLVSKADHCLPLPGVDMASIANLLALLSSFVYTANPDGDEAGHLSATERHDSIDQVLAVAAGLSTVIQDFQKRRGVSLELTDSGRDFVRAYSIFAIAKARNADVSVSGMAAIIARAATGGAAWLGDGGARQELADIQEDHLDTYSFCIRLYSRPGLLVQSRDDLVASCAFDLNNVIGDWMRNQGMGVA